MFIIDLDDTLLNTQAFKQARIEALKNIGVSETLYKKSYAEAYENISGINIYNSASHAEVLATYGFDRGTVLTVLIQVENELKDFLFPDAATLLSFLKKIGQKLILLSLGEENFQRMKIEQTQLTNFFDVIFTVNDTKEHIIEKILKEQVACTDAVPQDEAVWLINDKIEETKKLKQIFPRLKTILKVSPVFPEESYKSSLIPYFSTLTQIKQYVEQQLK